MSIRRDIVVVNEFSVPTPTGGSRGSTPGSYVTRYMARGDATESLAPIQRLRTDDFIVRYMARESAVERPGITRHQAKDEMRQAQGDGGLAFGYGSVSLSDQQLKAAAKDVQRGFDRGHTVLKTVLSFDEEYLRRHRIVAPDFHCEAPGDYRGHIDQMKLRMAVMHGMDRMSAAGSGFDDLRWLATIQVDTEHVHVHLAAYDAGRGQRMADGTQRGKLLDRHRSRLRRGVDAFLDEKQSVAHLSSAVGYERRNVTTYIKRWAHETMRSESLPQFLLACLPAERSLWRAGTNDLRMRKANELVTELVTEQLDRADSPMPAAMESIMDYANTRRRKEDLDTEAWQQLVHNGRNQIIERAVNGVYSMLRSLPENELRVRTPMLDVMSMDDSEMARMAADRHTEAPEEDDIVSFGFRLRSYSSRLQHHRREVGVYRNLSRQWEKADEAGVASLESRPLYDFYRFEADYQSRLVSKYQHFLPFLGDESQWQDEQVEVAEYGEQLLSLIALRADTSLQRMKNADEAERLGREIYDQHGGRLLTRGQVGRTVLDERIRTMREVHESKVSGLREDLELAGLVLRPVQGFSGPLPPLRIEPGTVHDFTEVKGLDLHHLGYDFFSDIEIGQPTHQTFTGAARRRHGLLLGAMQYLDESNQSEQITSLPVDDVASMTRLSRDLAPDGQGRILLPSRYRLLREQEAAEQTRRSKATSLDAGLVVRVQDRVDRAVTEVAGELGMGEDSGPIEPQAG